MLKLIKDSTDIARQTKSKLFKNCLTSSLFVWYFQINKTIPYCNKAQNTKKMQVTIHIEIEVNDFVLGDIDVMLLKLLIKTRYNVMSKAILSKSCGVTKLN